MPTPCDTNSQSPMEPRSDQGRFSGPVGRKLEAHDERLKLIVRRHGASRPRVVGSVARGDDQEGSDVDLLVEMHDPDYVGLEQLRSELEDELGVRVDLAVEGLLRDDIRERMHREAVRL
jgi:uncharacterized protein